MKSTAVKPKKQSQKIKDTKLKPQRTNKTKTATSKKSPLKKDTQNKLDNCLDKAGPREPQVIQTKVTRSARNGQTEPQVIQTKVTRSSRNGQTELQKELELALANMPPSSNEDESDENNGHNYANKINDGKNRSLGLKYIKLENQKFKCPKCSYTNRSNGNVKSHFEKEHSEKIYQCNQCAYQTKQQYYYNSHLRLHSRPDIECPYCKKMIKSQCYKMHIKVHERNDQSDYKCDFCDYKSYNYSNVKRHILTHHKNRNELESFSCDSCNYATILVERLKQHKKSVHSTEGTWRSCPQCDYTTRRKAHLSRHINDIHGEKKFHCEQCTQIFSNKDNLRYHIMRRHTDENQKRFFYCEMCPKENQYKSTEKGNLARHMLTHRTWDEIEVFGCHKCPYLAKSKSSLKIHFINSHMPEVHTFKCKICGYSTSTKSRFNCHLREVHGKPKARNKDFADKLEKSDGSDVIMKEEIDDRVIYCS